MTSAIVSLQRLSACQRGAADARNLRLSDATADLLSTRVCVPRQGERVVSKPVQFLHKRNVARRVASRVACGVAEVDEAARWARTLFQRERERVRFSSDDPDAEAISRVARRAASPRSKIHSLVRRPQILKDISAGIYLRLRALYHAECQRQIEALHNEIAITEALAGADHPDLRAAQALAAEAARDTGVSA